ncbi:zinc finger CCCH domain-containing 14 [Olea europaea subsp. europaea]|uniref:Zinc finger CCCH domain-containing 14 n=1 Tax=Olea europaea subsp. europaea TaxID=158383 RepID=A0A8S0SZF7_OLEEU|nr:zinc finger CCCH domain-containing 14 [Olea europaea subsp. europaea]
MQNEINSTYDDLTTSSATSSAEKSTNAASGANNPFLSPASLNYLNSINSSFYSTLFPQNYSPHSPSDTTSFDDGDSAATERRLRDASCILEYQQLYNSYTVCLAKLQEFIDEGDSLRRENDAIRLSNAEIAHRLSLLISELNPSTTIAAPQSHRQQNRLERRNTERISLPKSISVRSSGFLKMNIPSHNSTRHELVGQCRPASQRGRVGAGEDEGEKESLEFEAHDQGMIKTELCSKWQETGTCSYGENCQFAHGINELRPVIRHQRYKTDVCRIVLAGKICPYGHRCHFRHSLTEQELRHQHV